MKSLLRNGWTIAFVTFVLTTAVFTPQIWFPFFFVDLQRDFNATAVQTGWLGSVLWGSSLLLSPVSAVLEKHLGVKIVCFLGTALTPISYFISSIVNSISLLYLTFGVTYGLCVCLVLHSTLRMFYSLYDERNSQRALTLVLIGQFAGAVAGNGTVQRLLATRGWRVTLRYISVMVAITIPLPLVFYRQGKDKSAPTTTASTAEVNSFAEPVTVDPKGEGLSNPSFQSEREDKLAKMIEEQSGGGGISPKKLKNRDDHIPNLQSFLSIPDTWLISIAYFFTFSALAVYQVNFVSHFENMENLTPGDVWLIMTVTNTTDVVTRFFIMLIGGNFLCRPVYVIIASTLLLGLASFSYSVLTSVWVLVTVSLCFARSTTVVMSWNVMINLLGAQYADYVVTMVMYLQGFGYILGTLTPGALFDATGSYNLAFQFISLCFLLASGILTFLAVKSSRRTKTRRLSFLTDSSGNKKPRISLLSYHNNVT